MGPSDSMSMFRTRQQNVSAEISGGGEKVEIGGKTLMTNPGDFVISHPDGRREIMSALTFYRTYEPVGIADARLVAQAAHPSHERDRVQNQVLCRWCGIDLSNLEKSLIVCPAPEEDRDDGDD